jgi:transposase-like protein
MIKKRFDAEFKSRVALEAIKGDKTLAEISSEYKVHSTQIANWKRRALTGIKEFFSHGARTHAEDNDREIGDLYAQIGKLKVENDFLKKTVYPH